MPPENKTLDRIEKLLNVVGETVTKEEFVEAIEKIVSFVQEIQKGNERDFSLMEQALAALTQQIKGDTDSTLEEMKGKVNDVFVGERMAEMRKEINELASKVDGKLATVKDGETPSDEKLRGLIKPLIPLPVHGKSPDETILMERMMEKMMPICEKMVKNIAAKMPRSGGVGVTDNHIKFSLSRLLHFETPAGTINGSNKVFTTQHAIFAILDFTINGQGITDDQYTVSKNTITFTDAIPADLSGLSFRIAYV